MSENSLASWTITIEFKSNGDTARWKSALLGADATTIQVTGRWAGDGQQRQVDESIALDVGRALRMLNASGKITHPSEPMELVSAFTDAWEE